MVLQKTKGLTWVGKRDRNEKEKTLLLEDGKWEVGGKQNGSEETFGSEWEESNATVLKIKTGKKWSGLRKLGWTVWATFYYLIGNS